MNETIHGLTGVDQGYLHADGSSTSRSVAQLRVLVTARHGPRTSQDNSVKSRDTTSYLPPKIFQVSGPGAMGGLTTGGQRIVVSGEEFRPHGTLVISSRTAALSVHLGPRDVVWIPRTTPTKIRSGQYNATVFTTQAAGNMTTQAETEVQFPSFRELNEAMPNPDDDYIQFDAALADLMSSCTSRIASNNRPCVHKSSQHQYYRDNRAASDGSGSAARNKLFTAQSVPSRVHTRQLSVRPQRALEKIIGGC